MATRFFDALRTALGKEEFNRDLVVWAKTEYGEDWRWAYHCMKRNPGTIPHVNRIY